MPRRSRRRIIGKTEDIERRAREKELRQLEDELHQEWQVRPQSEAGNSQGSEESQPRRRVRKPRA